MADTQYLIQGASLEKLSNAVRENTGASEQMTIDEMAEKLNTGVVPINKGGTGATDAATARTNLGAAASSHGHNSLSLKGSNTIVSSGDDTTFKWGNHGNSVHWYTTSGTLPGKPSDWGYLINIGQSGEVHQVWMTQSSGSLYHRGGNGSGWSDTWREILDKSNFVNIVYPVGSIYLSYSTTSPASLFGGSWTQIKECFLWVTGTAANIGKTGGSQTHTLSWNEMPSHGHRVGCDLDAVFNRAGQSWSVHDAGVNGAGGSVWTSSEGGNAAHNNMPPYMEVFAWRRTG